MIHETYLRFSKEELLLHFADVKLGGTCEKNRKHIDHYVQSAQRYKEYCKRNQRRTGRSLEEMRKPCQIEKDERFWIANCMMTIFHSDSETRTQALTELFRKAYGDSPPVKRIDSWDECFRGTLHLFFEPKLPSPGLYKEWLSENLRRRHFIPYVFQSADDKSNLEGPTNADGMLLNSDNGFASAIEAKVLSDISYQVTYDSMRNQIARNVDVMLEKNKKPWPLNKRDPEKTLFLLVTPKLFKGNPPGRLYKYKFEEYEAKPESLAADLPHRKRRDWRDISRRLGWLTWEDFNAVNMNCCPWLKS